MQTQKLYIHGNRVDALSGQTFENFSPSTGEKICDVQLANAADVDKAVQSAQKGLSVWQALSGSERARILYKSAQILRSRVEELAKLEVLDTGKPISEALSTDVHSSADVLEYYAGLIQSLHGHHYDLGSAFAYTRREPLGVCAAIGAWNYPLQIACWKAAPALACGNALVFKPSELSPLTAMKLAEIFSEAGLPDGVFNVVQGFAETGSELIRHPLIRKVSLTGSVATGKKVMSLAAESLKPITLELGGKSPLIIFADCAIDQAIQVAMLANFYTQGEICSNGTRVFVEESILPRFIEQLIPKVKNIRVGDPMDHQTQMGALISRSHLEKVQRAIALGEREGAQRLCGGQVPQWGPDQAKLREGHYIQPCVFAGCDDDMTIVKEEIFGPLMSILSFKDESEVIARANQSPYGLAAGVFTRDLQRAHRVVAQLQAGICWINNYNITPVEIPFGGYKQSGIGRENGLTTIEHYTQLKSVYVEMSPLSPVY